MGQIHRFYVLRYVGGHRPELVVTEVERLQVWERVVDEDDTLQLIDRQIQNPKVPLVGRVVFVKHMQTVSRDVEFPQSPGKGGGKMEQSVVGDVQDAQVREGAQMMVQVG